jgi:hypothetical protein
VPARWCDFRNLFQDFLAPEYQQLQGTGACFYSNLPVTVQAAAKDEANGLEQRKGRVHSLSIPFSSHVPSQSLSGDG